MIDKDTFLKTHGLLNQSEKPRSYTFEDSNLPLKDFMKSSTCGTALTGYIVKKKNLYYYRNHRPKSKENCSAKKAHKQFLNLLSQYAITDSKYVAPFQEILYNTFIRLNEDNIKASEHFRKEIKSIEQKINRLEERFVFEEINKTMYEKFVGKLKKEKAEKETFLAGSRLETSNLKKGIKKALEYAQNLNEMWEFGDIETKRKIQYLVFPDGISYDFKNKQLRTFRVNSLFALIPHIAKDRGKTKEENCRLLTENSLLVESEGL